ncbi:hypothetical protein [Streptomyces sp. STR69]|uniref:hypothetical protein n=1 Tax=Streptomyces sp. STR69 TaxID=1796942 RepID=UPI0021C6156D|nr:hypothetical protein [Streptomyces sp. STR69]
MPDGVSNGQQSSESSTRNGVQALETAFSGIQNSKQDVENTRFNLASGYQGSDGGKYGGLISQWEDQCDIVLKNLKDVIEGLNQSLVQHGKQQGSSNDSIDQAYNQAQSVFDTLSG